MGEFQLEKSTHSSILHHKIWKKLQIVILFDVTEIKDVAQEKGTGGF